MPHRITPTSSEDLSGPRVPTHNPTALASSATSRLPAIGDREQSPIRGPTARSRCASREKRGPHEWGRTTCGINCRVETRVRATRVQGLPRLSTKDRGRERRKPPLSSDDGPPREASWPGSRRASLSSPGARAASRVGNPLDPGGHRVDGHAEVPGVAASLRRRGWIGRRRAPAGDPESPCPGSRRWGPRYPISS